MTQLYPDKDWIIEPDEIYAVMHIVDGKWKVHYWSVGKELLAMLDWGKEFRKSQDETMWNAIWNNVKNNT